MIIDWSVIITTITEEVYMYYNNSYYVHFTLHVSISHSMYLKNTEIMTYYTQVNNKAYKVHILIIATKVTFNPCRKQVYDLTIPLIESR